MSEHLVKRTGIKRVLMAAYYSYKGLKHGVKHEAALRQEFIGALFLLPIALILDVSYLEKIMLVGAVVFVFVVELLNTAVEACIDRIGPEFHDLSGQAKDMGSAAVLVSILFGVGVWATILYANFA